MKPMLSATIAVLTAAVAAAHAAVVTPSKPWFNNRFQAVAAGRRAVVPMDHKADIRAVMAKVTAPGMAATTEVITANRGIDPVSAVTVMETRDMALA
jgi:hypothetical protein